MRTLNELRTLAIGETLIKMLMALTVAAVAAIVTAVPVQGVDAKPKPKVPPFSEVQKVIDQHFAKKSQLKPGDLITKSDVAPVLAEIAKLGFRVEDTLGPIDLYLPEKHVLVQLLRSPRGTELMRKISHIPNAYDRLERLSWFPEGEKILRDTVKRSDNVAAVEQLCTVEAAREIEARFVGEPKCANFERSTGHVYTVPQFVTHLQTIHRLAAAGLGRPGE